MPNPSLALVYGMVLAVASVFAFGPWGLAAGLLVFLFWMLVCVRRPWLLVAMVVFVLIGCLVLPASLVVREYNSRAASQYNMTLVLVAMHSYGDQHGSFPPATVTDNQGQPAHSWRVLLLPWIEELALYERYDLAQPWNSPSNRKLLSELSSSPYRSPLSRWDEPIDAAYLLVTGAGTVFDGNPPTPQSEIADDAFETGVLVEVESGKPSVPWMQPRDLTLDQLTAAWGQENAPIQLCSGEESGTYWNMDVCWVAAADGSIRTFPAKISAAEMRRIFVRDDGFGLSDLSWVRYARFKWALIIGHSMFAILALVPLLLRRLRDSFRSLYSELIGPV